MKMRKMAAAALAAALAATNVAIVANAAEIKPEKTVVENGVEYYFYTWEDGTKEVFASPENFDITEAVILPEVDGIKVSCIGFASDLVSVWGFGKCTKLKKITIPSGVGIIPPSFGLGMLTGVTDIYYGGTQEEWEDKMQKLADSQGGTPFENCKNLTMHYSGNNDPAPSEPVTDDTSKDDTTPAAPGASEKAQEILDATLKSVDSKNGIEGAKLDELMFGDSGWTWGQVEKIEFSSEELFSVQYKNDSGDLVKLGDDAAARAAADGIWNTAWTLNTSEMAKDKYAKVIAKDGTADITVKVYIKKDAEKPSGGSDQKPTGIALAIAPVVLAAGAVIVISKKRK